MDHNDNHSRHNSHSKMMWFMMLFCLMPVIISLVVGAGIKNYAIIILLICCVAGHFLMMKFMGHGESKK